jgi:hypothetical protein
VGQHERLPGRRRPRLMQLALDAGQVRSRVCQRYGMDST